MRLGDLTREFIRGTVSMFHVTSSPLYRYPYRNAAEAFTSDWSRIGKDIACAMDRLDESQR